jgi:hypothetical protein
VDDPTELRRLILGTIIAHTDADAIVEGEPQTWTTTTLQEDFDVEGFMAPFVIVVRKADGVRGTLLFKHNPRIYFDFRPDRA